MYKVILFIFNSHVGIVEYKYMIKKYNAELSEYDKKQSLNAEKQYSLKFILMLHYHDSQRD